MIGRYHQMAKRAQYFTNLVHRFNLIPQELDQYLRDNSISDKEHAFLNSLSTFDPDAVVEDDVYDFDADLIS
jgi:hypothetical protein